MMAERERDDVLQSGSGVFTLLSDYDFRLNPEENFPPARSNDHFNVQPNMMNKNKIVSGFNNRCLNPLGHCDRFYDYST